MNDLLGPRFTDISKKLVGILSDSATEAQRCNEKLLEELAAKDETAVMRKVLPCRSGRKFVSKYLGMLNRVEALIIDPFCVYVA